MKEFSYIQRKLNLKLRWRSSYFNRKNAFKSKKTKIYSFHAVIDVNKCVISLIMNRINI